jgi:hypothetical protein
MCIMDGPVKASGFISGGQIKANIGTWIITQVFGHYFIWQVLLATCRQLIYPIDVSHSVDRPQASWN